MGDETFQKKRWQALTDIIKRLPAQTAYYGSALGAIVLAGGGQLPPGVEFVAASIGGNLLSNLIDEIARGRNISETEIKDRAEEAIIKSEISMLLTKQDFLQGYARLIRRLDSQSEANQEIIQQLHDGFKVVATAEQVEELKQLILQLRPTTIPERVFRSAKNQAENEIRQSAPQPPPILRDAFIKEEVVPFIGAGISISYLPTMPDYPELLLKMAEKLLPNELQNNVKANLSLSQIEQAAKIVWEAKGVGEKDKYDVVREILNPPINIRKKPSPVHNLLDACSFREIVTTNYDRLIEQFLSYSTEVITSSDVRALEYHQANPSSQYILKLHGDISRPETIHASEELLRTIEGSVVSDSPDVSRLFNFIKYLLTERTLLFLGASLDDHEGFYSLIQTLSQKLGRPKRTHFALVPRDSERESERARLTELLNIQMLEYEPDEQHSQIIEFLSFLLVERRMEPEPGKRWIQFYAPRQRHDYLETQHSLEKNARALRFLTPKLSNAFGTDSHIYETCSTNLKSKVSNDVPDKHAYDDWVDARVIPAMILRRNNIEEKLKQDEIEVKVMFLKAELDKELNTNPSTHTIERYKHFLRLATTTNLQVRLIPDMSQEDLKRIASSYALISSKEPNPRVDVAIAEASQATVNLFELHTVQINSDEVFNKLVDFERLWVSAWSERKSEAYIGHLIEQHSTTGE